LSGKNRAFYSYYDLFNLLHKGVTTKMSYKIYIENKNTLIKHELYIIGGEVASPTFTGITDANVRLVDAKTLVSQCARHIKSKVVSSIMPGICFIYRGVAVGGIQRRIGDFSPKPLTVKYKSLDPAVMNNSSDPQLKSDLGRLTGLVPIQTKLGKGGVETNNSEIVLAEGEVPYQILKEEAVGNTKSYLHCGNADRILSWVRVGDASTDKKPCTFLGDTTNPYLADWDLVLVGVTKNSIIKDGTIGVFKVIDSSMTSGLGILPQWLADCLSNQVAPFKSHVTQHGPESLYCGNTITQPDEEFLVLTLAPNNSSSPSHKVINQNSSDLAGTTPWAKTKNHIDNHFKISHFLYQFDIFTGVGVVPEERNYVTLINRLNDTLGNP
jgi:hypothetical protein